jgi:hypothetical protein
MLSKDMILASFSLIWQVKMLKTLLASLASSLKILIPPLMVVIQERSL